MIRIALLLLILSHPVHASPQDVTFAGEGVMLAGTLLIPEGVGEPPAVILVSGSGPQDRDETIRGSKPFLRIATHLARHGIATLRYDDRGVGGSTGNSDTTLAEEAADLGHALAFLCETKGLDHQRIGVLGHSMGGVVLSLVSAKSPPAFGILLATPAVDIADLLRNQTADRLRLNGLPEARIEINDQVIVALIAASQKGDAALKTEAERIARDLGGNATWVERRIDFFGSRMFRAFLAHDMSSHRTLTMPVLALFADADWKVDAGTNAAALLANNLPNLTIETMPDHNHLFQRTAEGRPLTATGPAPSEETLAQLVSWITETPPAAPCEAGQ